MIKVLNNLSIKAKILAVTLGLSVISGTIILGIIFFLDNSLEHKLEKVVDTESKNNLEMVTKSIYKSCEITEQVLSSYLSTKLNKYKFLIKNYGGIHSSSESVEWTIINQFSKEKKNIILPKILLGNSWFGKNESFEINQKVVDEINEQYFTFTIFQRINESGDMLRVATNVKTLDGKRAIGTYIPVINPDGIENQVLKVVLSGDIYFGSAFVVNDYYQTVYEPLKDVNGKIIGMIYVGVSLNAAKKLKESILATRIGETGYAYVLGASGPRKGYYIISKNGARDGESILDTKDADGKLIIQDIIKKATSLNKGRLDYINYKWKNKEDVEPQDKIVALMYYKPFDWVIGVGVNQTEYLKTSFIIKDGFVDLYIYLGISLTLIIIIFYFVSSYLSNLISNPIIESANIMNLISEGEIDSAFEKIKELK